VLTWTSLVKLTADRKVEVVQKIESDALYADSMAFDSSGALWIGMRMFLLRLTPDGSHFTQTWFVPENCQHMQAVDLRCVCH
jgi:sugar lactone lactonase YvrE